MTESIAARERAAKNITVAGAKEIAAIIREIAQLLNLGDAWLEAWPCEGKYRGICDYFAAYGKERAFFSNSDRVILESLQNATSKTRKTELLARSVTKRLQEIKAVFANKTAIWSALKERERKDNARAAETGLKPYRLKRVGMSIVPSFGYIHHYIVIEIGGRKGYTPKEDSRKR